MILPICVYGHPVLRRKAQDADLKAEDMSQLIADMFETMYHSNGVGLAAPQIGKSLRIFVIDSEPFKELYPEEESRKQAFINPTILQRHGDEVPFNEGCLSLPGVEGDVTRPARVLLRAMLLDGKEVMVECGGLLARCLQHEIDHLEGILFYDRIPKEQQEAANDIMAELAAEEAMLAAAQRKA